MNLKLKAIDGCYAKRTRLNAREFTLYFGVDFNSPGARLTKRHSIKGFFPINIDGRQCLLALARQLHLNLKKNNIKILNIAGNSIHRLKDVGDQYKINEIVYDFLKELHKAYPIEKIISGGQSGGDQAGLVAGIDLNIPSEGVYPKDYLRSVVRGEHIKSTESKIIEELKLQVGDLISKTENYE